MSLESCIRKAGRNMTQEDSAAIRAIRDDLVKSGTKGDVNEKAVEEYIEILNSEKKFIMTQVEELGGFFANPKLSPSQFSVTAEANLEEAARKFPRKGIHRPPTETVPTDYKTGEQLSEDFFMASAGTPDRLEGNITRDLLTERTEKTVEYLYPDFYKLQPKQVLAIVATFDPGAALGIAKKFNFIPENAQSLANMRVPVDNDSAFGRDEKGFPLLSEKGQASEFYDWSAKSIADWITKNETLPLYYRVDDAFERDFVESQPEHPLAQVTKYGKVVLEAEAAEPGPLRKLVNAALNAGSSHEVILGGLPQTKLKDYVPSMASVPEYLKTVKKMNNWMNQIMEGHHALAKRWLDFNRSDTKGAKMLGEFMHASTLAGVDVMNFDMPSEADLKQMNPQQRELWRKRQADYKALQPFWERLGKMGNKIPYQMFRYDAEKGTLVPFGREIQLSEAQFIFASVRDTYAQGRDMLVDSLEKRIMDTEADGAAKAALITKLRKQFEAGKINPYFPLSRFGKHQAVAKIPETGEVIAYIHRESRRERQQWMDEMRKRGFAVTPFEQQESDLDQMNKIDPGFVANVTELLKDTWVVDKETHKAVPGTMIQDEIWQMYLRTLPELSARKAYIHRIGRLGFTHDALRSFSDHSFHTTHQMAKLRYAEELSQHLMDTKEDSVDMLRRADDIKNLMTGWRPKGFEGRTVHETMWDHKIGGARYRELYSKFKKAAKDTSVFHEPSYEQARDQLMKEAAHDGPWAVPLANEMVRRHAYNMNPKSAAWSTKLTALGFLWFLSTSPAAGVLNLTQTAVSAYPILRARFAGAGAGMELLKAAKEYASSPWLGMGGDSVNRYMSKLRNEKIDGKESDMIGERAAMEYFQSIGMFSKTRTRELQGLSDAGTAYSARQEQILEITGWIFHKTEEMNRAVTAMAVYRLARKKYAGNKGMTLQEQHNKAVEDADELVEMSHYDYTNTNRPRFMQGDMSRVVFLFRNYSLNMTYRLMRDFRDGVWKNDNITKEARKEARSRLLGIIGMTTLFAGVGGWPMIWMAEVIANNMLGDDDDPFDSKTGLRKLIYDATEKHIAEGWGETVANAVMKGPWSELTGTDLSTRASLNNLWIREIPENVKGDFPGLMTHLSGEMLGPIWGMGMNMAGGFNDIQSGHPDRGVEKLMPKFVSDGLKSIRFATQGAQTYNRDMILSPEEFTAPALFMQAAGFTPTQLATRYEQNRAVKDMEIRLKDRRQDLLNQLFMAWRIGDRKTAAETLKSITQWNKAQPRFAIMPESIMDSANSRSQYDMRTVGGVSVDKRLQYLHEQLRFTDRKKQ